MIQNSHNSCLSLQSKLFPFLLLFSSSLNSDEVMPSYDLPLHTVEEQANNSFPPDHLAEYDILSDQLSLEETLSGIPGISFQKRGPYSLEPNIRGFAGERVTITWDEHPLPIAAPTRTASVINFFSPTAISEIRVFPSFPSVGSGSPSIGGKIDLRSNPIATKGCLNVHLAENQNLRAVSGTFGQTVGEFKIGTSGFRTQQDDYQAADGRRIDSDVDVLGCHLVVSKKGKLDELKLAMAFTEQRLVRNISLPLDSKNSTAAMLSAKYSRTLGNWRISSRAGYANFDINMTAEDRIKPPVIQNIQADSTSENASFALKAERGNEAQRILFGIDGTTETRDAIRYRHLISGTYEDHIWPSIQSNAVGLFSEYQSSKEERLSFRVGGRVDFQNRKAQADFDTVSLPLAPGSTINENYAFYSGPEASKTSIQAHTATTNALFHFKVSKNLSLIGGVGYASALPDITYQYRSFVSALGGDGYGGPAFEIGNPSLDPEQKSELNIGLNYNNGRLSLHASTYYAQVDDFVVRRLSEKQAAPAVFTFVNEDAQFSGVLISGIINTTSNLSFPFQYSWTDGRTDRGDRLAEITPWTFSSGMRWRKQLYAQNFIVDTTMTHTAARTNSTPLTAPIYKDTAANTLLSVKIKYQIRNDLTLSIEVQNILNADHYFYLQPPVSAGPQSSSGSLKAGDSIPGIGRNIGIHLEYQF